MPSKLGLYTLYETLGRGAQGVVKRATNEQGHEFAIKIANLENPEQNNPRAVMELFNEVQALIALQNKQTVPMNIVGIQEFAWGQEWKKDSGKVI